MCKQLTLVNREDLGKRVTGYIFYNGDDKSFIGLTVKQIKDRLVGGDKLNGFILNSENEIILDGEGFHQTNYMIRSGISTYEPLEEAGCVNLFYTVVGMRKDGKECIYEVVSSRFARQEMPESKIKMLLEFGCIQGGVYLDSKGRLTIAEGVQLMNEDAREAAV